MNIIKIQEKQAIEKLAQSGEEFISLLDINHLLVEIYKPNLVDKQSLHILARQTYRIKNLTIFVII